MNKLNNESGTRNQDNELKSDSNRMALTSFDLITDIEQGKRYFMSKSWPVGTPATGVFRGWCPHQGPGVLLFV